MKLDAEYFCDSICFSLCLRTTFRNNANMPRVPRMHCACWTDSRGSEFPVWIFPNSTKELSNDMQMSSSRLPKFTSRRNPNRKCHVIWPQLQVNPQLKTKRAHKLTNCGTWADDVPDKYVFECICTDSAHHVARNLERVWNSNIRTNRKSTHEFPIPLDGYNALLYLSPFGHNFNAKL